MAKTNTKPEDTRFEKDTRLAGGMGQRAAVQGSEALLRRAVMACLLWEDMAYESGRDSATNIAKLVADVPPEVVAGIAIEARTKQKLRHVPLYIAVCMARLRTHRGLLGDLLPQIILRADEPAEFLAMYWKDGKVPLANQVKDGLARALADFDEYQLAKYDRDGQVKLRDALFMVHGKPSDIEGQSAGIEASAINRAGYTRGEVRRHPESVYTRVVNRELKTPDTWETALSSGADKAETFTRLIQERRLGGLALLRNLRNMVEAGVKPDVIYQGLDNLSTQMLLPLNFLAAAKAAPTLEREIENAMLKSFGNFPKLGGLTALVVDVSGSMSSRVSARSEFDRIAAASAMAIMATEVCEHIRVYATAGSDSSRGHQTALLKPRRGFALVDDIKSHEYGGRNSLGGGGIFTRQCIEYIKDDMGSTKPDRIMVFSDSQDCDWDNHKPPAPNGDYNYIIDVSAHSHGVNYKGVWTAEISGWSQHFLEYVAAFEGLALPDSQ